MLYRRIVQGLRLFKIKNRSRLIKRNHATYNYSKPPPGSENNHNSTGKSAKTLTDINFNIDRISVSLKTSNSEENNAESKPEPQQEEDENLLGNQIKIPHFDEIDFDYLEIALNQECVKDWYHEVLRKNELEYYGKINIKTPF